METIESARIPGAPEQQVADALPIEASAADAERVLAEVPFWFHTFLLNREHRLYTPGAALDHRYRLPAIPADFSGMRVLDVGAFDGFYAFLAESRGAERVVAIDNEQYVSWVKARWGTELRGGEGFRAIADLLGSGVEYRRLDALQLDRIEERFDFVFCFGILHRVENPLGLLRGLRDRLEEGGRVLVETHGISGGDGAAGTIRVPDPGEVYANDDFVFWEFGSDSLARLGRHLGFAEFRLFDDPEIAGHPRLIGELALPPASRLSPPSP